MERFVIKGGKLLQGEIKVKGAKNAALKILAASLLSNKNFTISNVPQIEDVFCLLDLMKNAGSDIDNISPSIYRVETKNIKNVHLKSGISQRLKGSILMAAPLLVRKGEVFLPRPGGCVIGQRPRDIFLDGFEAFGAKVRENKEGYHLTAKKLKGTKFIFPLISVTATETMILTAVMAEGKTILKNSACEPEIVSLADFLNKAGARIKGVGTPTIEIEGVKSLNGVSTKIIPDRIESGSFIILGAASHSPIKISGLEPNHLEVLWSFLKRVGVNLEIGKDYVKIKPPFRLKSTNLKTHEYPGFPTDLQAPFTVLMTQSKGVSLIHETIFEGRLFYTDTLNQMGAKIIMADPHRVIIQGPTKLQGRYMISPDIRAGIALLIAALIAKGESIIENIYQIDRGYENIEGRLQELGADIKRINN